MKMPTIAKCTGLAATAAILAIAISLSGCPSAGENPAKPQPTGHEAKPAAPSQASPAAEKPPTTGSKPAAKAESPEPNLAAELEQVGEKPRDLGPPLVDRPERLVRLNPVQPVWIDKQNRQVVLQGEVCSAGYPLEFFATYSNRSYEAVMSVNVTPRIVHAGLVAIGAVPGHPAQFQPNFVPPTGTEVAIEVRWKDAKGKVQSAPAQQWIRNIKTKKALDSNWVFAGSLFVTDETSGKQLYTADSGELICVLSLPTAMLDLPVQNLGLESRLFEAFKEHLPPPGTPTTVLLKPMLSTKSAGAAPAAKSAAKEAPTDDQNAKHAAAEKNAIESAQPWLALIDQGQYSQSWETAADYLKSAVDRRDFIKSLAESRKPLGSVQSRELFAKQYTTRLPGAPDGQYVVVQYKTSFANKKSATETVTPMLDKDKKWRVSGYFVK